MNPFLSGLYVNSSIRLWLGDQKWVLPIRFNFLSPIVRPEIYPLGVLNLIIFPLSKWTIISPSFLPVPVFTPKFILDYIQPRLRINFTIYSISSANKIECCNWRMMTNLFNIDWTSVNWTLESLTKNRIKWFLHSTIKYRMCKTDFDYLFHLFNWILHFRSWL